LERPPIPFLFLFSHITSACGDNVLPANVEGAVVKYSIDMRLTKVDQDQVPIREIIYFLPGKDEAPKGVDNQRLPRFKGLQGRHCDSIDELAVDHESASARTFFAHLSPFGKDNVCSPSIMHFSANYKPTDGVNSDLPSCLHRKSVRSNIFHYSFLSFELFLGDIVLIPFGKIIALC